MKKVLLYLLPLLLLSAGFVADGANPALQQFNQAITFYASFDGHATADLSNGKGVPTGNAQNLEWKLGVWGQALQGRNVNLLYDATDNVDLLHSGSLMMWIAPSDEWTDADDPIQLSFAVIHDQGKSLSLARQGGKNNGQALMAIYGPQTGDAATRALIKNGDTTHWKTGEWHLLAVNWSKGYVELSMDGNRFIKGISPAPDALPTDDKSEYIALAGRSTEKSPYLMDELMILNRPLTNDEVKVLFQKKP
jgi:hypothetical protein